MYNTFLPPHYPIPPPPPPNPYGVYPGHPSPGYYAYPPPPQPGYHHPPPPVPSVYSPASYDYHHPHPAQYQHPGYQYYNPPPHSAPPPPPPPAPISVNYQQPPPQQQQQQPPPVQYHYNHCCHGNEHSVSGSSRYDDRYTEYQSTYRPRSPSRSRSRHRSVSRSSTRHRHIRTPDSSSSSGTSCRNNESCRCSLCEENKEFRAELKRALVDKTKDMNQDQRILFAQEGMKKTPESVIEGLEGIKNLKVSDGPPRRARPASGSALRERSRGRSRDRSRGRRRSRSSESTSTQSIRRRSRTPNERQSYRPQHQGYVEEYPYAPYYGYGYGYPPAGPPFGIWPSGQQYESSSRVTEVLGSPERPVNPRMRAQREVVLSPVKWPGERTEQDVSPTPMNSQNVSGSPVWGGNTDSNENTNGSPGWGSNKSASGNADIDENANDLPSWGEDQQQGSQQGSPQNQAWKNSPQKDNQQETWGSSLQKDQIQESPGLGQQWASSPKQDQAQTWGSPQKYGSAQQSPINKNTRNQNKQKGKASGDKWGVEKKKKNVKNSREVKFVIHQPIKDAGQSSTGGGGWNTNGASNPSSPSGWNDNGATNTNSPSADAAGWNSDGATNPTSSQATQASAGATSGWNSGGASNPTSPDQPTPPARKTFSDAWGSPEGGGFAASVRTVSNDGDNEVAPTNNSTVEGETPAWNVGGAGSPGGGTGWD